MFVVISVLAFFAVWASSSEDGEESSTSTGLSEPPVRSRSSICSIFTFTSIVDEDDDVEDEEEEDDDDDVSSSASAFLFVMMISGCEGWRASVYDKLMDMKGCMIRNIR